MLPTDSGMSKGSAAVAVSWRRWGSRSRGVVETQLLGVIAASFFQLETVLKRQNLDHEQVWKNTGNASY